MSWLARLFGRRRPRGVRTAMRDVADGEKVKVVGRVKLAGRPVEAPVSGRPCVCWEVRWARLGKDPPPRFHAEVFLVETDRGDIVVRPSRPELSLAPQRSVDLDALDGLDARTVAFCESIGMGPSMRRRAEGHPIPLGVLTEGILGEGDRVAVTGIAAWELDPYGRTEGLGYRDVPRRLTIVDPRAGSVLITNHLDAFPKK